LFFDGCSCEQNGNSSGRVLFLLDLPHLQNLDVIKTVQGELQSCVTELDKLKKVYFDDEHVSHDARDKAREAEEK
jgi:hypothetical protein